MSVIKELLSIAVHLAESLSERIPKSGSLQRDCKQVATNLRTWRKSLPTTLEFLLEPTGDKGLYRAILSPLSELLCILCMSLHSLPYSHSCNTGQLIWTTHELGKPPSLATVSRTNEAEHKIISASPSIKKFMDELGTSTSE